MVDELLNGRTKVVAMKFFREICTDTIHVMASIRFFAQAREAAGVSTAQVAGTTVGEVLENAVSRWGDGLAAVIKISKVWVNGEEVSLTHPISDNDEVAVLPPVSGGM